MGRIEYNGNLGAISRESLQPTIMVNTDEIVSALEDAERAVYAFHQFRNQTSEEDWEKLVDSEETPLQRLLDCMMDLECSMDMENDDEYEGQCVSGSLS